MSIPAYLLLSIAYCKRWPPGHRRHTEVNTNWESDKYVYYNF